MTVVFWQETRDGPWLREQVADQREAEARVRSLHLAGCKSAYCVTWR